MKTTIENISPDQAKQWLEGSNSDNRIMRPSVVRYLVSQIASGNWKTTHQGIAFAEGGRLIDGQHRLAAIALSGTTVKCMVTRGLDDVDSRVMDCGLARTISDRLTISSEVLINRLACSSIGTFLRSTAVHGRAVSVDEIETEFATRSASWMWAAETFHKAFYPLRRAGFVAAFAIYHDTHPLKAKRMAEAFISGVGLESSSPTLRLRNYALTAKRMGTAAYWHAQGAMLRDADGEAVSSVGSLGRTDMLGNENRAFSKHGRKQQKGLAKNIARVRNGAPPPPAYKRNRKPQTVKWV